MGEWLQGTQEQKSSGGMRKWKSELGLGCQMSSPNQDLVQTWLGLRSRGDEHDTAATVRLKTVANFLFRFGDHLASCNFIIWLTSKPNPFSKIVCNPVVWMWVGLAWRLAQRRSAKRRRLQDTLDKLCLQRNLIRTPSFPTGVRWLLQDCTWFKAL